MTADVGNSRLDSASNRTADAQGRRGNRRLTDRFVQTVKPPAKDKVDHFDAVVTGLALRVSYGGGKSWVVIYRSPIERDQRGYGKLRRLTLGKYPAISLEKARNLAGDILDQVDKGEDPQLEKRRAKANNSVYQGTPITVADGIERYVEEHVKVKNKPRKKVDGTAFWEREQLLKRHVVSCLGSKVIGDVTRKDVMAMHRQIEKGAGTTAADRAAEALRAAFNWLEDTELVANVPRIRLAKKARRAATTRHRVLSDDEIKAVWSNLYEEGPFATIVRLLLLTGQRRSEVAEMRWEELDLDKAVWEIPADRTKNQLPHIVPLAPMAVDLLKGRNRIGEYVFTTTATSPFSGFSRSKERLDGRLKFKEGWTLHDLRRTFVTRLNELGVPPHVVEACVNHVSGSAKAGIAGVYNKAEYLSERKAAMERWATELHGVLTSQDSNVVDLEALR